MHQENGNVLMAVRLVKILCEALCVNARDAFTQSITMLTAVAIINNSIYLAISNAYDVEFGLRNVFSASRIGALFRSPAAPRIIVQ